MYNLFLQEYVASRRKMVDGLMRPAPIEIRQAGWMP